MRITEQQLFNAAAAIVAGAVSNPANPNLLYDSCSQIETFVRAVDALKQAIYQTGGVIVTDDKQLEEEPK